MFMQLNNQFISKRVLDVEAHLYLGKHDNFEQLYQMWHISAFRSIKTIFCQLQYGSKKKAPWSPQGIERTMQYPQTLSMH